MSVEVKVFFFQELSHNNVSPGQIICRMNGIPATLSTKCKIDFYEMYSNFVMNMVSNSIAF